MSFCILIADDEQAARYAMKRALESDSYEVEEAVDGQAALEAIQTGSYDLVFLDLSMPKLEGREVLRQLEGKLDRAVEIIVVTADDHVPTAVECIQLGAADYITKPYEVAQVRSIARRAAERAKLHERVGRLENELEQRQAFGALVGVSRPMRELFSQMQRAAKAPVDVLVLGETGTGKELIAREIHRLSDRSQGPFIAVNTAAIAETLAESELFGHVRGAFTGADADRVGFFEQASGGTLFLDEIGDMPLAAQTKILRSLQERSVQPVGSSKTIPVDVRVISATHQDLNTAIDEGHFRQDLYYRIKGVQLNVPPLRQRREDIILLANFFLARRGSTDCEDSGDAKSLQLTREAIDALLAHRWPGNVRELEQMIVAAAAMACGDELRPADLQLPGAPEVPLEMEFAELLDLSLADAKSQLTESFERRAISAALDAHSGNVSAAARQLGIHRQSLQQKMTRLGIQRD
jgi:DNA-binding NtrC family response regulator